jgi:hypothetical protein
MVVLPFRDWRRMEYAWGEEALRGATPRACAMRWDSPELPAMTKRSGLLLAARFSMPVSASDAPCAARARRISDAANEIWGTPRSENNAAGCA